MIRFKRVVNGHLIIRDHTKDEQMTVGGILIPKDADSKAVSEGTVLQFDVHDDSIAEMGIREGDRVLYSKFSAEDLVIADKEGKLIPHVKTVSVDSLQAVF